MSKTRGIMIIYYFEFRKNSSFSFQISCVIMQKDKTKDRVINRSEVIEDEKNQDYLYFRAGSR